MGGTGVIDHFLEVFTRYIDSGFGLLGGEVAFIATTLIVIDMTMAALFWSWGADEDIIARLVKKTLFVGVFAYIIGNWNALAKIVFESFAGLGLKASGTGFSATDLLRPGRVAQVGLEAGRPILESISGLMGYIAFFENFIQITVLLFAWVMVLLAFFILAIQLFVTLIEFKLTTLAGFVLIPFGLFGQTAFLAERVLGNVVSSGVKVLVLAVVVGIGSTLFAEFTRGFGGNQPSVEDAMAVLMNPFRRASVRYGRTPEPETPYQKAAQVWDERIGAARVQAKNWRLMAFGSLILSAGLSFALVWQSLSGTVVPWVVQVDKFGEAQAVAPAIADYRPADPQVAWHLARFIEQVRAIPADPVIVRQNWLRAYEFTTDRGAAALNDYARANDPFAKVGRRQVAIEVSSVIRASPDSFRVAWTERSYENGQLAATERWTAILTIAVQQPRDADRLKENPLGIYVNAINWSKELGQ
jgi:P-type conjugative transfer protein TrbL